MINQIEHKISKMNKDLGRLEGQIEVSKNSISSNQSKIEKLKVDQETHSKAIEIINYVQEQSRDKVKDTFENIVTYALRFIYSTDYEFGIEFDRRGNLGTMNFNIKSPDFQEPAEPINTSGGGVIDIVALALRMVLLQLGEQKGPVILDESLKHLSKEYLPNAVKFLNEINKRLNRQIIFITHQQEFIDNAEYSMEIK